MEELGLEDADWRCYIGVLRKEKKVKSVKSKRSLTDCGKQALKKLANKETEAEG